jgi:hypothetical protein
MARVLGIGGLFFRATDPVALGTRHDKTDFHFLNFVFLTAASRGFEPECGRLCGVDLSALESEFWQDVEHRAALAIREICCHRIAGQCIPFEK